MVYEMDVSLIEKIAKEIVQEIIKEKDAITNTPCKAQEIKEKDFDTKLASAMEHSMIRPDATPAMVKQFCDEAVKYGFRNVALAPCFVALAARLLKGTGIRVSTAVAFPMGIASEKMKVAETIEVIENGATEIDLPVNIGLVKAGELKTVKEEIDAVVGAAKGRALIKVVVDLGALSDNEKIKVALIAKMAGADFLKIAATTRPVGVNAEDIKFFRQVVGPDMGLKADGGIKDFKSASAIIEAGGTTIGASGSIKIVTGS